MTPLVKMFSGDFSVQLMEISRKITNSGFRVHSKVPYMFFFVEILCGMHCVFCEEMIGGISGQVSAV